MCIKYGIKGIAEAIGVECDCEPSFEKCPECDGSGFYGGDGFSDDTITCDTCGGSGYVVSS